MSRSKPSSGLPAVDSVVVTLAGDVMLGRLVRKAIRAHGYSYPWGDILPALEQSDLFLVNLECALTSHTRQWHGWEYKPFHFRADPDMVQVLTAGGVHGVSLANNHIGDFELAGLRETIQTLDHAGIAHAGAGPDLSGARTPARFAVRGRRITLFATADYPAEWAASPDHPGMHYLPIPPRESELAPLLQAVEQERTEADFLILSLHWGPNMSERPSRGFRAFAHRMAEAGIDILWGHSAHVPQGIEVQDGKLILYDTGDLIDDYAVDPDLRNDRSALFRITLGPVGVERLEVIPTVIEHLQARLALAEDAAWTRNRLLRLSGEFDTELTPNGDRLRLDLSGAVR